MEMERRPEGVFASGRSMSPSSSPGSLLGPRGPRDALQGRYPKTGAVAGRRRSCHLQGPVSGEGRSPRRQGGTRDSKLTGFRGAKEWGRGDSREGRRPKATPFGYAFPVRALQLPAAPANDFLPLHPTPPRLRTQSSDLFLPPPRGGGTRKPRAQR